MKGFSLSVIQDSKTMEHRENGGEKMCLKHSFLFSSGGEIESKRGSLALF